MENNTFIEIRTYEEQRDYQNIISACKNEGWKSMYLIKKEQFHSALSVSDTLVAYDKEKFCGFIRCISDKSFTIYCCELIVIKEYRRCGIGTKLISSVMNTYPTCRMEVISANDKFYESNDFTLLGNGMRKRRMP